MTLPSPPRPISSHVRWRAAVEPHVRGWWIATIAIVLLAIYFSYGQVVAWKRLNRLLSEGVAVEAMVMSVDGIRVPGSRHEPDRIATMKYAVDGVDYEVTGNLPGRTEPLVVQRRVTIHADPNDPRDWTGLTRRSSLGAALAALWTILPLALLSIAGGLWARARLLRVYRDGRQVTGTVEGVRQTALAPTSRLVRCTLNDADDARIYSMYVPNTAGRALPVPGDAIEVLHHSSGRVAAVGWFGEGVNG